MGEEGEKESDRKKKRRGKERRREREREKGWEGRKEKERGLATLGAHPDLQGKLIGESRTSNRVSSLYRVQGEVTKMELAATASPPTRNYP